MTDATVTMNTKATLKQISEYFRLPGQTLKEFTADWQKLSDEEKDQLKLGLGNGTLTY